MKRVALARASLAAALALAVFLVHPCNALAAQPAIDLNETATLGTIMLPLPNGLSSRFDVHCERRAGVARIHGKDLGGNYLVGIDAGDGLVAEVVGSGGWRYLRTDSTGQLQPDLDALRAPQAIGLEGDAARSPAPVINPAISARAAESDDRLDIIVLYTQRALQQVGRQYIDDVVAAGETRLNAALVNSSVPYTAHVVAVEQTDLSDPPADGLITFLNRGCGASEVPNNRQSLQDRYRADAFFYITGQMDVLPRGLANVYGGYSVDEGGDVACGSMTLSVGDQIQGLAVTFTHEVGHILGGGHDRGDPNHGGGWKEYSHAKVCGEGSSHQPLATAMALAGIVQPYFSSPDKVAANGDACGVPAGDPNSADNARTLRESLPTIVNYKARMATPSAFSMEVATTAIGENAGHVSLAIDRAGDLSQAASVEFATIRTGSSQATAGTDYQATVQRVAFAAGESRKSVDVVLNDNTAPNATKTFGAVIRYPENADIGSQDETVISITDNDTSPGSGGDSGGSDGGGALGESLLLGLAALGGLRARRNRSAS